MHSLYPRLIKFESLEVRHRDYDLFKVLKVVLILTTELKTTALYQAFRFQIQFSFYSPTIPLINNT